MKAHYLTITAFSHHFCVSEVSDRARQWCLSFAKKYAQWKYVTVRGQGMRMIDRIYGASVPDRSSFRFHKNQLKPFLEYIEQQGVSQDYLKFVTAPMYEPTKIQMTIADGYSPREHQVEPIAYLDADTPIQKLVGLQMGKGKGYCTIQSIANQGVRWAVVVRNAYMHKWANEIVQFTKDVKVEDILLVNGSAELKMLIMLAKSGQLDAKVIIISNKTMQNWFKDYEEYGAAMPDHGWDCWPWEFYETLGVGVRVIDEVHLDYHLNFKQDLYTHVPKTISLSATLVSEDPFLANMYELAYPMHERWDKLPPDKYIEAYPVYFRFERPEKIRVMEFGRTDYSHNAFEQSIMRQPKVLQHYFELTYRLLDVGYLQHERKEKGAMAFFYTTEMCRLFRDWFKAKHPNLDVRTLVQGDPDENLYQADVVCSTLGSGGTARDKPNLVCVVLTQAISSIKSNLQSFGRLRALKGDDHNETRFYYFVCTDVPKHIDYDIAKQKTLRHWAKSCRPIYSGAVL